MESIDKEELLSRLKELGPLGEEFEQAVRRGLEVAATLPEEARHVLLAQIFEATSVELERQKLASETQASLQRVAMILGEVGVRLRALSEEAREALRQLRAEGSSTAGAGRP